MAKVILGPVRLSYPYLFEPRARKGDERKKYSVTILIDKKDTEIVEQLQAAIKQAEIEAKDKKFNGKIPPKVKTPVHDGDGYKDNGEEFGPECKGCYVLTATTDENYPPKVLAGRDGHPASPDEVYAGCYGYVSINLAGYNFENTKKGIGAYLNNVWKTKDGEPLGFRRKSAKEDFMEVFASMEFDDEETKELFDGLDVAFSGSEDTPF